MNKKVIKALFTNIVSTDPLRSIMQGVHFEKERCYASDGHILVIYNEGSETLDGKTMSAVGEVINGRYPNVDSVFPAKSDKGEVLTIDFVQLKNACAYHIKQLSATQNDIVVIGGIGYNIRSLLRLLNTIMLVGNPRNIKFHTYSPKRATTVESDAMIGLIMPTLYKADEVDEFDMNFEDTKTISYENFINNFVFNGWRKPKPKEEFVWAI